MAESQSIVARLYEYKGNNSLNSLPLLKIDDKNIRFLQDALLNKCVFRKEGSLNTDGREIWWLTFFQGSNFEKVCAVEFQNDKQANGSLLKDDKFAYYLTTAVYAYQSDGEFGLPALRNSELIRETKAIGIDKHNQSKSSCEHVDGKGLSFITSIAAQQATFERSVILLALAQAYRLSIESLSNKLSSIKDFENLTDLTNLHREVSEFNARYFFFRPVKYSNTKLTEICEQIFDALQIDEVNEELTKQVANIHHIIELQYSHKMQELEKQSQVIQQARLDIDSRRNYIIGAIGIVLAIIELLW